MDVEGWNKLRRFENPVSNFLEGIWYNNGIYNYIYNKFLFKENLEGIICPIPMGEGINPNDMERVGFKGDKTVMNLENYSYGFGDDYPGTIVKFIVENDLIPLYLQALIDTNRSAAGADMATNLKKIYEMIFYVLENLENQEGNEEKIEQLIYEVWEKTPLIPESE